ncbi:prolipoprotein diacylglyceryl transferase [Putridiphycobacter roseus]|uniref:Prolipoprotein diacylglyceryl transferase n=1 Tax=Putridiphycobacter roseus TaxID=2219161 RepID=A0A2W1MXM1_9FLAO|nr:DUF6787 family protein [Putridiphycobacter roseus]PZE16124.1 prolipoprotein diacylglyceryl transferase [Putridiphycobacter roseus]
MIDKNTPPNNLSNLSWIEKLQKRWGVNYLQVLTILFVFAITGTTILLIKKPVLSFFSESGESNTLFSILYYLLILPIYNIVLLFYGFILGQFYFFWEFEKRTFRRIKQLFSKKK